MKILFAWNRYHLLDAAARRLPAPAAGKGRAIVVCSPGHIGDVLHAVPMLKALRAGKPAARIVWLVGPWSQALAQRFAGLVDEIRVFGPNLPPFTRGRPEWRQNAWTQWRLALDLRREGVDCLIAPADPIGRFLANAVCPRLWTGIGDWRPPRVRTGIQTHFQPYETDRYEADALCGVLSPLGIAAHADRLEYVLASDERQAAEDFLKSAGVDPARPLGLVAPGSGWSGKNWLPERFGAVADWLVRERRFQIAWIGSGDEAALLPAKPGPGFNWMGKTPLPLLAAVMSRAGLFIGNDGGLLHLAAALDVPTVSIWGPTSPGKWGPKGLCHRQIRKVERCEGCIYWDYRETCRHDHACMRAVAVEDVLGGIRDVLNG